MFVRCRCLRQLYLFSLSFLGLTPESLCCRLRFRGLRPKSVGSITEQDYNAYIMCSRESCAVLPSHLIASLLIFLAAFLIGVSAAQLALTSNAGSMDLRDYSAHSTCLNQDGVDFYRVATWQNKVFKKGLLIVANHGAEPISFSINPQGRLVNLGREFADPTEMNLIMKPSDVHVFSTANSLKFAEMIRRSTPGYDQETLDFTFSYLITDSTKTKTMHVVFNAEKGFPSQCSSY